MIKAHSKFSASGAERWLNCSASVAFEEKSPPSADSKWSLEGTLAHEVLESILKGAPMPEHFDVNEEMIEHCFLTAQRIRSLRAYSDGKIYVEQRVHAKFIHSEMFGTCDAIIDGGRTLYIIDFKYGQTAVAAAKNPQLIQYALSVAGANKWKWEKAELWIMQPRINHFDKWVVSIKELREEWLPLWNTGVLRVLKNTSKPSPGHWCHWCRAKNICPAKTEQKVQQITNRFNNEPLTEEGTNGHKETANGKIKQEKESQTRKQAGQKSPRQKSKGRSAKEIFSQIESEAETFDAFEFN